MKNREKTEKWHGGERDIGKMKLNNKIKAKKWKDELMKQEELNMKNLEDT
jgi:hypothetical protein